MSRELAKPIIFFVALGLAAMMMLSPKSLTSPIFLIVGLAGVGLILFLFAISRSGVPNSELHGSAKWASTEDLVKKDLLVDNSLAPIEGSLILGPAPNNPTKD